MDWVEKGNAPAQLVGAHVEQGFTTRTRPLCPYPQVARYKGDGSIDEAANFFLRRAAVSVVLNACQASENVIDDGHCGDRPEHGGQASVHAETRYQFRRQFQREPVDQKIDDPQREDDKRQ